MALVGFMAAGKSTVGRRLARDLGVGFCDTDALIVARHGPIPALFERIGEPGFRELEFAAVGEALALPPGVVALGGGAVTHEPTRALLAGCATRVYLQVPARTLAARLARSRTARPLAGKVPDLARIRELLSAREGFYRESEIVVRGPRGTQAAFARAIAEQLRARA